MIYTEYFLDMKLKLNYYFLVINGLYMKIYLFGILTAISLSTNYTHAHFEERGACYWWSAATITCNANVTKAWCDDRNGEWATNTKCVL